MATCGKRRHHDQVVIRLGWCPRASSTNKRQITNQSIATQMCHKVCGDHNGGGGEEMKQRKAWCQAGGSYQCHSKLEK